MRPIIVCCALALTLAACGGGKDDQGPGGVGVSEAAALNDAAAALDNNSVAMNKIAVAPEAQQ